MPLTPLFENSSIIYINYKVDIFWANGSCPFAFEDVFNVPLFRNIALSHAASDVCSPAFRLELKSGDLYYHNLKNVFLIKSRVQAYPRMKAFEFVDLEEKDVDLEALKASYETECREMAERKIAEGYRSTIAVPIFHTKRLVLDQSNARTAPFNKRKESNRSRIKNLPDKLANRGSRDGF